MTAPDTTLLANLGARLSHLALWRPALRVLCYHRVDPRRADRFSVTTEQLDRQLNYLVRAGFDFIHVRDLLSATPLPPRPLLLTFDDGYLDNLEHAQPILQRHGAKATIFIVTDHTGDISRWNTDRAPLMARQHLRELDPEVFELASHSHTHRAFAELSLEDIERDVRESLNFFREHDIAMTPALAYPYGSRPKQLMPALAVCLAELGIALAFRVGNRLNRLPLVRPYDIQRIDVSGKASHAEFRRKLWLGKLL
jgi:peptidoglycan/xylan/chitin deacetylase (PgdA/CDA1 family)